MQLGRGQQRDGAVVGAEQQLELGAAEDDGLRAGVDETREHALQHGARRRRQHAAAQLVEDRAVEHLPVGVVTNLARFLADVKRADLWVFAAAGDAPASMWSTDLSGGVAFVLGAEGRGLRPLVRKTCDAAVSIPLGGRVESLNVSVAAALLLYEARRQRAT